MLRRAVVATVFVGLFAAVVGYLFWSKPIPPQPSSRAKDSVSTGDSQVRDVMQPQPTRQPALRPVRQPSQQPVAATESASLTPSISGTVRIHGTSIPAVGAVVRAVVNRAQLDGPQGYTDAAGSYTLTGVPANTDLQVWAENPQADLFSLDPVFIAVKPGDVKTGINLTVYTGQNGSISGRVFGARFSYRMPDRVTSKTMDGEYVTSALIPLAGVKISLEGRNAPSLRPEGKMQKETITDESGRYRFDGLRSDGYYVRAERPQKAVIMNERNPGQFRWVALKSKPLTDVDFYLRLDGMSIVGRVTDNSGRPIEGAKVVYDLPLPPPLQGWPPESPVAAICMTGEDGRYRLDNLPPATLWDALHYLNAGELKQAYDIRAEAEGYSIARRKVPPFGDNVIGVALSYREEGLRSFSGSAKDLERIKIPKVVLPEGLGNVIRDIDFVLTKAAAVMGHVVDTRGSVVVGPAAEIEMIPVDSAGDKVQEPVLEASTVVPKPITLDKEGRFAFIPVAEGKYVFEVRTNINWYNRRRAKNEVLTVRDGETVKDLEIIVELANPLGNISGTVIDAASKKPVEAFKVKNLKVSSPGDAHPLWGQLAVGAPRTGVFSITKISPGTTTLEITSPGYARQTAVIEVPAGQTAERTFHLAPEASLSGRISLLGEGKRSASVLVYPIQRSPKEGISAQADKDGNYEFKELAEGDYWVRGRLQITSPEWVLIGINELKQVRIVVGQSARMDFPFQESAGIAGEISCADQSLGRCILVLDPRRDPGLPVLFQACVTVLMGKTNRYEIRALPPGTYTVIGRCTKKPTSGVSWEPFNGMEKSRTVTLTAGQIERVDFVFP